MIKINSIEWHKENLKNSESYEKIIREELSFIEQKYLKLKESNEFLRFQIQTAIKEKKDSFDKKYLINRRGDRA